MMSKGSREGDSLERKKAGSLHHSVFFARLHTSHVWWCSSNRINRSTHSVV